MGILRFRVAAREEIEFGTAFVEFIRGTTATKPVDITYSNGTGQTVTANQVLYTYLTPSDDGYIQIKAVSNQTLTGSGILNLSMIHRVSSSQSDQNISFNFSTGEISINVNYNSKPVAGNIIIDIENSETYIFQPVDFTSAYSDADGDALDAVSITGNVDGYQVNGIAYNEGDWISMATITAGLFQYVALTQDAYYEKDNTWNARDINGNISN